MTCGFQPLPTMAAFASEIDSKAARASAATQTFELKLRRSLILQIPCKLGSVRVIENARGSFSASRDLMPEDGEQYRLGGGENPPPNRRENRRPQAKRLAMRRRAIPSMPSTCELRLANEAWRHP
jgi:hypothetical protein